MNFSVRMREPIEASIPNVVPTTLGSEATRNGLIRGARFEEIVTFCEILADLLTVMAGVAFAYAAHAGAVDCV
jgi:hypothetical protein